MDKLQDFKGIADEMMKNIQVSEELKAKTLQHIKRKKTFPIGRVLVPAACLLLTLGFLNISGMLPLKQQEAKKESSDMNILMDANATTKAQPDSTESNMAQNSNLYKSTMLQTIQEAKKAYIGKFLTPDYIPETYELTSVLASGGEDSKVDQVVLNYISGDKAFMILEDKSEITDGFQTYKEIAINGAAGYIMTDQEGSVELHWFIGEGHYSISGQLKEEEAVKIAEAMKE